MSGIVQSFIGETDETVMVPIMQAFAWLQLFTIKATAHLVDLTVATVAKKIYWVDIVKAKMKSSKVYGPVVPIDTKKSSISGNLKGSLRLM